MSDKRITVLVDLDTHKQLKVMAALTGSTMSDIAWEAIRQYLQKYCKTD